MSLLSDIDDQLDMLRPMADKASGLEAIQLNEQIIKLLDEKDTLLGAGAKYKDGGQVLDRRMFMRPVMAAEGVYMPTIEQILNFYMGEFTDDGRPTDMEAFQEAIDTARKAEAAGLFPGEGKPIDNYLYFGQDQKDFVKETGKDLQQPTLGYFEQGKPTDEMREYLADVYTIPARKEYADSRVESDKTKAEADARISFDAFSDDFEIFAQQIDNLIEEKGSLFKQLKTSSTDQSVIIENQIYMINNEINRLESLRQEATNGIVKATAELFIIEKNYNT